MRTPKTAPSAPRDAAMDGGLQDGCLQGGGLQGGGLQGGGSDVEAMHVRTETVEESPSALVVSSQEPPARCGGGGGGGGGAAEEAATCPPVLLSSATPPAPPSTSDFSSRTVLCLIEAIGRRWGLYETRERSQLFQSVQEEMASKGHRLPVNKIRRKWNNLIVTYKRVKDRSRETGHAKTSWEFFDLMDAMLCDTVGSQIIINRRKKCTGSVSFTKVAVKPEQLVQPPPPAASLWPGADPGHMTSTAVSTSNAPELKPPIVVSGDSGRTSSHPSSVVPPITSSPGFTETATSRPPDGTASTTDLNTSSYTGFSPGVVPYLSKPPCSLHQDIFTSSLCPTSSCLSPPTATPKTRGQNQMGRKEQSSVAVFQEILRRQKEQAYLDGVARRRVEAREKRRERREVRMSESLDRIASALELLSSKQDTVIRLLQRLANRT